MNFLCDKIIPYIGTDTFKLGDSLDHVRFFLKSNKIPFNQSVNPNKWCEPSVPWTIISVFNSITLCFAKDILFEIVFENEYIGKLPNGGCIGMDFSELEELDNTLIYNDDDEDFISKEGYWVVDSIETGKVVTITIYLPEVEEDDFFDYDWVLKYRINS